VKFDRAALKRLREERGLSQRDLATAAGVSPATISRLEGGVRVDPKAGTVTRISRALNTSVEELIHP